jgi:hypothetical protein
MDSIALCDSLGDGGVQAGRTYVEENVRIRKPGRIDRFNQAERHWVSRSKDPRIAGTQLA